MDTLPKNNARNVEKQGIVIMATDALTKLIAENKERPIAEAPRGGTKVIARNQYNDVTAAYYSAATNAWHYSMAGDWQFGGVTHFRPLPDDRLARVTELYDEFIERLSMADMTKTILNWPKLAQNIREHATAIAEGKE